MLNSQLQRSWFHPATELYFSHTGTAPYPCISHCIALSHCMQCLTLHYTTYRLCVTLLSLWSYYIHDNWRSIRHVYLQPGPGNLSSQSNVVPCTRLIMALFWCHVFHPSTCPSLFPDKYVPECLPGDHDQGCLEKWGYNAYLIVNEN